MRALGVNKNMVRDSRGGGKEYMSGTKTKIKKKIYRKIKEINI